MRTGKHTVPTHLNVPDKVLTIGPLSLTARQFLLLLIGSSFGYNLWHQLHGLSLQYGGPLAVAVRCCLALLPVLVTLAMALMQIGGRSLESWFVVLLRYWVQPKRYVWRTVRLQPALLYAEMELESELPAGAGEEAQESEFAPMPAGAARATREMGRND